MSQLTAATLCWAEGQAEWLPLPDIPELQDVLQQPAQSPGSTSQATLLFQKLRLFVRLEKMILCLL